MHDFTESSVCFEFTKSSVRKHFLEFQRQKKNKFGLVLNYRDFATFSPLRSIFDFNLRKCRFIEIQMETSAIHDRTHECVVP